MSRGPVDRKSYLRQLTQQAESHYCHVQPAVVVMEGTRIPTRMALGINGFGCRVEIFWDVHGRSIHFNIHKTLLDAIDIWIGWIPCQDSEGYCYIIPSADLRVWLGGHSSKTLTVYRKVPQTCNGFNLKPYVNAWHLLAKKQKPEG